MDFIYDIIEELCIKKGVNITKMCKDCKIPRSKLTDYKNGRLKSLSLDVVSRLADYFGVSIEYLYGTSFSVSDEERLKQILFGNDYVVTDEVWQKIKDYAIELKSKK